MVYYVVEHLEEGLSDWCRLEYMHMMEIVTLPDMVVFTNVKDENIAAILKKENSMILPESLQDLINTNGAVSLPSSSIPFGRVCLLDMQAEKELSPEDTSEFDVVVFGGILGNVHIHEDGTYSSDDKTALVRDLGFADNRRHLGLLQMTTDTALLVTHEILNKQKPMSEIKFIDHPEIGDDENECTVMEGFRYVADGEGEIVLPKGMRELLKESMDFDLTAEF